MDFFESQEKAKRSTWILFIYLFLSTIAVGVASTFALSFSIWFAIKDNRNNIGESYFTFLSRWQHLYGRGLVIPIILSVSFILVMAAIRILILWWRQENVLVGLAEACEAQPKIPAEKVLVNIVEEMAIAASLPAPKIYIMNQEESINAFCAGFSQSKSLIVITQGALNQLTRDELQGMIAHEFSHILNGDARLNWITIGLVFGFSCFMKINPIWLFLDPSTKKTANKSTRPRDFGFTAPVLSGNKTQSSNSRSGAEVKEKSNFSLLIFLIVFIILLFIIGVIGNFIANFIKYCIARKRELLADAAAIQFTRNPDGIVGVLRKIQQNPTGSRVQCRGGEELSHLFFAEPGTKRWLSPFSPIDLRIAQILEKKT